MDVQSSRFNHKVAVLSLFFLKELNLKIVLFLFKKYVDMIVSKNSTPKNIKTR